MSASLTAVLMVGSAMIINGSNFTLDKKFDELWNSSPPLGDTLTIDKTEPMNQLNPDVLLVKKESSVRLTLRPDIDPLAPQHQGFYVHGGLSVLAEINSVTGSIVMIKDLSKISVSNSSKHMYNGGTALTADTTLNNHAILCDKDNPDPITIVIKAARDLIIPLHGECQIIVSEVVDFVPDID